MCVNKVRPTINIFRGWRIDTDEHITGTCAVVMNYITLPSLQLARTACKPMNDIGFWPFERSERKSPGKMRILVKYPG